MIKYSIVIAVYNRPEEVVELLESLTMQSLKAEMEVIIVEDGSQVTCAKEIDIFRRQIDIKYIVQENQGPGRARNNGAAIAQGEYLLFFDSDCVLPSNYLAIADERLKRESFACFGGPDRAHKFFTRIQKAISYSMTSFFTTGGIRGGRKKVDRFYPRSFNLGVKKSVFDEVGGFSDMRYGEDIDFSMKVYERGYVVGLMEDNFVYHKRRNTFRSFFKQVFSSGTARIDIASRHSKAIKPVHVAPALFVLGVPCVAVLCALCSWRFALIYILYLLLIAADAYRETRSVRVGLLSVVAAVIQIGGYGLGFLTAMVLHVTKRKRDYVAFRRTFYN